jgi:hypothetical protein
LVESIEVSDTLGGVTGFAQFQKILNTPHVSDFIGPGDHEHAKRKHHRIKKTSNY